MDNKKCNFIKNVIINLQDFLGNQKEDEVPENCLKDLDKVLIYIEHECPDKLEPNYLPKTAVAALQNKYGSKKDKN